MAEGKPKREWTEEQKQKMDRVIGLVDLEIEKLNDFCKDRGLNMVQCLAYVPALKDIVLRMSMLAMMFGLSEEVVMATLNKAYEAGGATNRLANELGVSVKDVFEYREAQKCET